MHQEDVTRQADLPQIIHGDDSSIDIRPPILVAFTKTGKNLHHTFRTTRSKYGPINPLPVKRARDFVVDCHSKLLCLAVVAVHAFPLKPFT
ncbi:hypothetical protein KIPE111705_22780 [Kibdelosporangium persicum]